MYLHHDMEHINRAVKINREPYGWILLCHSKPAEHVSFVTDCPQRYCFFTICVWTGNYGDVPQGNRRHFQPWPVGDYLTFSEAKKPQTNQKYVLSVLEFCFPVHCWLQCKQLWSLTGIISISIFNLKGVYNNQSCFASGFEFAHITDLLKLLFFKKRPPKKSAACATLLPNSRELTGQQLDNEYLTPAENPIAERTPRLVRSFLCLG